MTGETMIHCLLCIAITLSAARTEPAEAVARGRDALDRTWAAYPWYDAAKDGVRPVKISKPEPVDETPREPRVRRDWTTGAEILKWAIWLGVAAVLLVVAFLLVRTYLLERGPRAGSTRKTSAKTDHDRRFEALPFPVKAARFDLLAEARRHYQEGRYGEAIKYLFSFELVELDKHRVVRLARGKTNRQYLREMGGPRLPLGGLFEATMVVFEDFFFGDHRIDRLRFEACWSRLGEFEARLKGETP